MKRVAFFLVFFLSLNVASFAQKPLTIADIRSRDFFPEHLSAIQTIPGSNGYAQISDDGRSIIEHSFVNGKQTCVLFSLEECPEITARSIDTYKASPDGKSLLIITNTESIYRRSYRADIYVYDIASRKAKALSSGGKQQSPLFSADGSKIAFVRNNNIFVVDVRNGMKELQITTDGEFNKVINGIPDWVNEEEFGFSCAMAFSADASSLSWIRYDESAVKTYDLQKFKGMRPSIEANSLYPSLYSYKYPKAGEDNSVVSAHSYDFASGKVSSYDLPLPSEGYIPRVYTADDKKSVVLLTLNRHQDSLCIYKADPLTGKCQLLLTETSDKYLPEAVLDNFLLTKDGIFIMSDRTGYRHIYRYDYKGKLIAKCIDMARNDADGKYDVTDVYGYDEARKVLYFQAAKVNAMEREVYSADMKGNVKCLSARKGTNSATFASDFKNFVNLFSDRNTPYVYSLCSNNGKVLATLVDNKRLKEKLSEYQLPEKTLFSFTTSEGVLLNGWMMKPVDFDENKRYPVVMHQYGGPGSQQVTNSWSIGSMGNGGLFDSYLTQQGFIVVTVDGRGTGCRGSEFEKSIYLHLGEYEAKDQVETALYLGSLPYVDKDNIAIWGWSFGGFNTLMSMSEGRPVFKAGVAIAPPTNWRFYDSVYTERYMRTPKENPEGYTDNPISRAANLHGALLMCHGLADDNVHPQNAFEYSEALVQADKDFRELIYTNRNHGISGGNTRTHLLRQVAEFFKANLK